MTNTTQWITSTTTCRLRLLWAGVVIGLVMVRAAEAARYTLTPLSVEEVDTVSSLPDMSQVFPTSALSSTDSGDGQERSVAFAPYSFSMRSTLMNSRWIKDASSTSSQCEGVLRSLPRTRLNNTKAPKQLPRVGDNPSLDAETYWSGFVVIVGVCVLLGILSICTCWGFCMCRCLLDGCGGRHADLMYTPKEVNLVTIGIVMFTVLLAVCTAFGWTGNIEVSSGIDSSFSSADDVVSWGTEFIGLITTGYDIASQGLELVRSLNTTLQVLPTNDQLNTYANCVVLTYNLLQAQQNLTSQVLAINSSIGALSSLPELKSYLVSLNSTLTQPPLNNLTAINTNLNNFNTSLYTSLPNLSTLSTTLSSLQTSFSDYSANANTTLLNSQLQTYQTLAPNVNTAFVYQAFNDLDSAYNGLPDLNVMSDNIQSTSYGQTQGPLETEIQQVNTSVTLMLATCSYAIPAVQTLQTSLTQLQGVLYPPSPLLSQLAYVKAYMVSLPNLTILKSDLTSVQTFAKQTGPTYINRVLADVKSINATVVKINYINRLYTLVNSMATMVSSIKKINIGTTITTLITFNNSLNALPCMLQVFSTLQNINSTLVALPDSLSPLLSLSSDIQTQIAQFASTRSSIQTGYTNLLLLNSTLYNNLPNLDNLLVNIVTMNNSINKLPNWNQVYDDVNRVSSSLQSIPDLSSYISNITSLNASLHVPNFDAVNTGLQTLNGTVTALPNLSLYLSYLQTLNSTVYNMPAVLNAAYQSVSSAAFTASGFSPASSKTALLAAVQALNATVVSRPNSTLVLTGLSQVNLTMTAVPSVGVTTVGLTALSWSINQFPNLTSANSQISSFSQTRSNQASLNSLLNSQSVSSLQSSIASIPDLSKVTSQLDATNTQVNNANFNNILSQINKPALTFSASDRDNGYDRLISLKSIRDQIPDLNNTISDGVSAVSRLVSWSNYLTDSRTTYYVNRDYYGTAVANWDGARLLVFNLIMILPFILILLGLLSRVCKYSCPAMFSALFLFPLITLFFIMGAIQMPVALLFSDHCYQTKEFFHVQFADRNITANQVGSLLNLTTDMQMTDLYDYFAFCEGNSPEILTKISNPGKLLDDQGYNITKMVSTIKSTINLPVRPTLQEYFDLFTDLQSQTVTLGNKAYQKITCTRLSELYSNMQGSLCTDLSPYIALTTCVFLLSAFCMMPTVWLQIRAFKRFNPNNIVGSYIAAPALDLMHEDMVVNDPDAAYRHKAKFK